MDFLNALKERIPDYAKDIRLNLDATIGRSSLDPADALGAALAGAFAAKSKSIIDAILGSGQLSDTDANGALTAAALMGMNTVWYPYVEMADDADLKTQRAELRMNAYATHGGSTSAASNCSRSRPASSASAISASRRITRRSRRSA